MLALCAATLTGAALYFGRSIFAPVAFSLFIITIVWPFQKALQRRMPRYLALLLCVLFILVVLTTFGYVVIWAVGVVGQWTIRNAARFQALYAEFSTWLEEHGIMVIGLLSERFDVMWLIRILQEAGTRLNDLVGFSMLVFAFTTLGLVEVEQLKSKLESLQHQYRISALIEAGDDVAAKFRKYMMVRGLASVVTGFAVWAFAFIAGLEPAAAWGTLAFALNFIPFIGPLFATILPVLFALVQLDSWQMVLPILVGLGLIQFLIGTYLEPWFAGASLQMSPFVVLFSVFFWAFMWGIPGAIIGVPLTIAAMTMCEIDPSTRWISTLLSGEPQVRETTS